MIPAMYICGTGNVGSALLELFRQNNIIISGIFSRKKSKIYTDIPVLEYGKNTPSEHAMVFICTPDSYIGETEKSLGKGNFMVVHCSGSVHLDVLQNKQKGVFYPLQSFTKNQEVDWLNLPILIEANNIEVEGILKKVVNTVGSTPVEATSQQREKIHLAAVIANNFSNSMYHMAFYLASKSGFSPDLLMPLIQQTVAKLAYASPAENQTGPAKRGDTKTLQRHLELLKNEPEIKEIYQILSNYISGWEG